LIGLPPSLEEIDAFVHDYRPDAYERLIDRLLASPHYGEQWGRHWLDVVRFGESNGFERNQIINNAWPFRDYIIRSFNEDKPFDRLIIEHLAGDVIADGDPQVEVGTTFLVCGPYDDVGNQDPVQAAQIRANTIDDMIRATGETFLGLTVGCGRCHDHKFDPISQRDYYSLYAAFAGAHHGSREVGSREQKEKRSETLRQLAQQESKHKARIAHLEKTILSRAESQATEFEARWSRPPVDRRGTEEVFSPVEALYVRLDVSGLDTNPSARAGFRIDEFEVWSAGDAARNVALASNGGRASGNSRVAEDFAGAYSADLTIDGQFGAQWIAAGPILTIQLAAPTTINRVRFSSDRSGAAGNHPIATFVADYRIEVSRDGENWSEVANSLDRQPVSDAHRRKRMLDAVTTEGEKQQIAGINADLSQTRRKIAEVEPLPSWWIGEFREAKGPFHVFLGGSPQRTGEEVVAASLTAFDGVTRRYGLPPNAPESERRRALANWLVSPDNPLTPRVLVNRLWHYHMGTGIVDTPSDFGFMGGSPTHPLLLDWLARQLHAANWRLKPLHRLILTSQTYCQSSDYDPAAARIDAGSRYLWRFPPRRLSGEEIRDSMLVIAGKLDRTAGGPGFRLYRYLQDNVATYVPLDRFGPETYRRAVYHQNARATRIDLMTEFDCPDSAFAAPRRASTTTPLQALTMMNHSFTMDMARFFAERIQQELPGGPREAGHSVGSRVAGQVDQAFRLAFARSPSDTELAAGVHLVQSHGLVALCRALLNSNELIYLN
jgi:hypothetical protein